MYEFATVTVGLVPNETACWDGTIPKQPIPAGATVVGGSISSADGAFTTWNVPNGGWGMWSGAAQPTTTFGGISTTMTTGSVPTGATHLDVCAGTGPDFS